MVADCAWLIAVMSWGDAALQPVPVAHDTNGVTSNEPDDLRVSSSPFRAIALVADGGCSYFPRADTSLVS